MHLVSIIQTFSSQHFCNHLSEARPEVGCAGDITGGLDNGGQPGQDVAWEVEAGVLDGPVTCDGQLLAILSSDWSVTSNTEL